MTPELLYIIYGLVHLITFVGVAFALLLLLLKGTLYLLARFVLFRTAYHSKYLTRKIYVKPTIAFVAIVVCGLVYSINLQIYQRYTQYRPDIMAEEMWGEWEKEGVRLILNEDRSIDVISLDTGKSEYFGFGSYDIDDGAVYLYDKQDEDVKEMVVLLILGEYRLLDQYDINGNHPDLGFKRTTKRKLKNAGADSTQKAL